MMLTLDDEKNLRQLLIDLPPATIEIIVDFVADITEAAYYRGVDAAVDEVPQ